MKKCYGVNWSVGYTCYQKYKKSMPNVVRTLEGRKQQNNEVMHYIGFLYFPAPLSMCCHYATLGQSNKGKDCNEQMVDLKLDILKIQ